ncbi:DUF4424 family protein [Novosphingobium sp. AP12]|uniref:DUF4424 family protein n=1 Tax=Novosphingobium sp. AP12 TaxID=1144305 RepID=UPI0012F70FA9
MWRSRCDKGTAQTLVGFCGEGVRTIGPTTFEMRKRHWRPQKDFSILFLHPFGANDDHGYAACRWSGLRSGRRCSR